VEEVRRERGKGKEGEWGVGLMGEMSDWASLLGKGIRRRTLVGVGVMVSVYTYFYISSERRNEEMRCSEKKKHA